jgi:hypothetical protein
MLRQVVVYQILDVIKMNRFIILSLFFAIIITVTKTSQAQVIIKRDTVYYLIDKVKGAEDQLITIQKQDDQNFLTIHCPCLYNGSEPVFRYNSSKSILLSQSSIKSIKFIYLKSLIQLVHKNDDASFDDKFTIFFIRALNQKYLLYRAHFLGSQPTKMQ